MFLMYLARTLRWHMLVRAVEQTPSFYESWVVFNIGAFLANITPAKLGEIGRAAYVHRKGLHGPTAIALSLVDRVADVLVIGVVALVAMDILFDSIASLLSIVAVALSLIVFAVLWKLLHGLRKRLQWLGNISKLLSTKLVLALVLTTIVGWACYFWWGYVLALSVGIRVDILAMSAILTLTGVLSLLPIAPSGLGTRDAALIFLLVPIGVEAAQAEALATLMFLTIMLWSTVGAWYWWKDRSFVLADPQSST